jgi:predicted Zn-dependent protease
MRYPMIIRLAVGVSTVAIALTGCGGNSSGGAPSGGLSKTQLAAKADAACTAYNEAAQAIPQPPDFPSNPVSSAAYLEKLKVPGAAFDKAVQSLKPNSSAKPLWDRFVAAGQHVGALQKDAEAKARANDRAGLAQDFQAVSTYLQSTLMPIAYQLGATVCASQ